MIGPDGPNRSETVLSVMPRGETLRGTHRSDRERPVDERWAAARKAVEDQASGDLHGGRAAAAGLSHSRRGRRPKPVARPGRHGQRADRRVLAVRISGDTPSLER
ncbi:hypothetical protein GCM10010271_71680 [Streptomyces kurssanovii]|nr:hypothetical protein GCM10010271_71680 [Streptomyces kurssanovii]